MEPITGAAVANVSHLLSVLVLYGLGLSICRDGRLAFVAAVLHIFSPAGLFLSAPYAESTFSLLSFTGHLLLAQSCQFARSTVRDVLTVLAGIVFGLATAFRSNGILNGIPFAWWFVQQLTQLPRHPVPAGRRLFILGIGGVSVALGSVIPQFVAYRQFCSGVSGAKLRPWCNNMLPSIYTFVQHHYW